MWMMGIIVPFLKSTDVHFPPRGDLYLAVLNGFSRLCLMGIAETPGCATLLPASLFVSSHPGTRGPFPLDKEVLRDIFVLCLPGAAANSSISSVVMAWTGGVGTTGW